MERSLPDWNNLRRRIAGVVDPPDSPVYDGHAVFNARFHGVRPQAIVRCAHPQDVAETISFVRQHGLQVVARSGGHCFGGRSSTRGVVIDVTPMDAVSVTGDIATIGAGARLGHVYDALQERDLTIPGGTCPLVGIAGLALGGGLGILGRKFGLTSDRLVAAQIVLADGSVVDCDVHHDEDLFWALRGAGAGNFGVVTSLTFRTLPAPEVTNFHLAWPAARAVDVIEAWQGWAPEASDALAASLKVTAGGDVDRPPAVDLYGALLGSESDAAALVEVVVARAGVEPTSATHAQMSWPQTRRYWAQLGATEPNAADGPDPDPPVAQQQPTLFVKSEFFRRPLPNERIAALVGNLSHERASGESRELDFMPWGGAYNSVPADATAFVHRHELFQLKHAAEVDLDALPGEAEAARQWAVRSWATAHPWGSGGVFPNFADPDLEDWSAAYYGSNYDRLVRVKTRYDPSNLFRFHQSLPIG